MLREDSEGFERFGEIYFSYVYPGVVKGWHIHDWMTLNYAVPVGMVKLGLLRRPRGLAHQGQRARGQHRRAQLRPRHHPAAGVERVQGGRHRSGAGGQLRHHPPRPRDPAGSTRSTTTSSTTGRSSMAEVVSGRAEGFVLDSRPVRWGCGRDVRAHREGLRSWSGRTSRPGSSASLGVLWAVAVPILQGLVMAFIFSKVIRTGGGTGFAAYVMSGTLTVVLLRRHLGSGVTSIVDGSGLTDKVWFPRVLLVGVPAVANLIGLFISLAVLLVIGPLLGAEYGVRLLLVIPARSCSWRCPPASSWCSPPSTSTSATPSSWFRPPCWCGSTSRRSSTGASCWAEYAEWVELNPMTGVVSLFHEAFGQGGEWLARPVLITVAFAAILVVLASRPSAADRLFVDRL